MYKVEVKNDLAQKYTRGNIIIHWFTAILILTLFPLGKYMSNVSVSEKMNLIKIHAIFGIIVFVLTIARSYLFFKSKRPDDLKTGSKLNDKLAIWIHNAFYFLLIGISIAGLATMISGGYVNALKSGDANLILAKENIAPLKAHGVLATIMMILLALHILGVIKHYVLTKENTLKRMS